LPLTSDQLNTFTQGTGRSAPPTVLLNEAWLICGRRAGKSFILALIAVFLGCFHEYRQYLAPGERRTIVIIAADRKQARTIFRYVRGLLNGTPMLKRMIERETADAFDLSNRISIEIQAASFRSTRGYTLLAAHRLCRLCRSYRWQQ
jgi:phage terminase large subunit-like protein